MVESTYACTYHKITAYEQTAHLHPLDIRVIRTVSYLVIHSFYAQESPLVEAENLNNVSLNCVNTDNYLNHKLSSSSSSLSLSLSLSLAIHIHMYLLNSMHAMALVLLLLFIQGASSLRSLSPCIYVRGGV